MYIFRVALSKFCFIQNNQIMYFYDWLSLFLALLIKLSESKSDTFVLQSWDTL